MCSALLWVASPKDWAEVSSYGGTDASLYGQGRRLLQQEREQPLDTSLPWYAAKGFGERFIKACFGGRTESGRRCGLTFPLPFVVSVLNFSQPPFCGF